MMQGTVFSRSSSEIPVEAYLGMKGSSLGFLARKVFWLELVGRRTRGGSGLLMLFLVAVQEQGAGAILRCLTVGRVKTMLKIS